jgi:hypothetical protein
MLFGGTVACFPRHVAGLDEIAQGHLLLLRRRAPASALPAVTTISGRAQSEYLRIQSSGNGPQAQFPGHL